MAPWIKATVHTLALVALMALSLAVSAYGTKEVLLAFVVVLFLALLVTFWRASYMSAKFEAREGKIKSADVVNR